jgi:hypothetical protein
MSQNLLFKPHCAQPSQLLFKLNIQGVDELFPGFAAGDFAVLYGSQSVASIISLLCARAKLPSKLGGLGSNVIFIDGGNTFRADQISRLVRLQQFNSKQTLDHISVSRAFTAYQLTSLILEKLKDAVKKYGAKLVIISDIANFFLDSDIADEEVQKVYGQIVRYLANFAKENQIIIIATYPYHESSKRNSILKEITTTKANTVLCLRETKYSREIELEKHPSSLLGTTDFPFENFTLTHFI